MNKKADIEFDTILKMLITIIVLLVIIGMSFFFKDKILAVIDKIKDLFRFGV